MNVDLDAIAQRGRCEVSSLRLALPLIEQGYSPPFLARYRRDELGGIDEASLWSLSHAVRSQKTLDEFRDNLHQAWQSTPLVDPSIGRAITGAKSQRLLDRLSRRVKAESGEANNLAQRLAVRVLNPSKGDGDDLTQLAQRLANEIQSDVSESTDSKGDDASEPEASKATGTGEVDNAIAKLDDMLAKRLCGDPRVMGTAVRWLSRHAKIHIVEVKDPHGTGEAELGKASTKKEASPKEVSSEDASGSGPKPNSEGQSESSPVTATAEATVPSTETTTVESTAEAGSAESKPTTISDPANPEALAETETTAAADTPVDPVAEKPVEVAAESDAAPKTSAETTVLDAATTASKETSVADEAGNEASTKDLPSTAEPTAPATTPEKKASKKKEKAAKAAKKNKKISPRQRRRRWLVSTLKPLSGKRMPANKLSSFQLVMLGRALRSQVAQCAFDYDAAKLVAELQKTASGINRHLGERLAGIVLANEAIIRDAAEGAWWDELQEQASARLVSIAADNLHRQMNRGGVEAKVVMSIDAVGPRTAATSIVAADGRILHNEDIPCQLSASMRTLAVTKMGELIHAHNVDLIVISNGPARRACMIAVGELLKQSAEKSVRWTLADRSGADAYAGSSAGDQEMRTTPRRFRAAAWIAFFDSSTFSGTRESRSPETAVGVVPARTC